MNAPAWHPTFTAKEPSLSPLLEAPFINALNLGDQYETGTIPICHNTCRSDVLGHRSRADPGEDENDDAHTAIDHYA
jgi:hypothetical protein